MVLEDKKNGYIRTHIVEKEKKMMMIWIMHSTRKKFEEVFLEIKYRKRKVKKKS
jgi:hypothetical protein